MHLVVLLGTIGDDDDVGVDIEDEANSKTGGGSRDEHKSTSARGSAAAVLLWWCPFEAVCV